MLFTNNLVDFLLKRKSYIEDYYIGGATLATFCYNNKLSPNTPSSIDKSKLKTYIKMHQEYLERTRIAHNYSAGNHVYTLGLINGKIKKRSRELLNYGYNSIFGYLDTTGTASGYNSYFVKQKALTELIEKNDVLVMWYKLQGEKIVQDLTIKQLINSMGFYSEEIFVFASKAITNLRSFIVFLFNEKKLIGTGVSCNVNEKKGLKQALLEAKLIESFRGRDFILYSNMPLDEHVAIYERVKLLDNKAKSTFFEELIEAEIVFNSWINEIEFAILNTKPYQDWVTIRVLSEEMLNAIPQKYILLESLDKKILQIFNITRKDIETTVECNVL